MTTKINPRQIRGSVKATLKEELAWLEQNIGYFLGAVNFEADLSLLKPKVGNVAFVNHTRQWLYWTGADWQIVNQGGSGAGGSAGTGSGGGEGIIQVTKLSLTGLSKEIPKVIDMTIPYVEGFRRSVVEVLKFHPDEDNIVSTIIDFVNADEDDFNKDPYIDFTGSLLLQNRYERTLEVIGSLEDGKLHAIDVDLDEFASMQDIIVEEMK